MNGSLPTNAQPVMVNQQQSVLMIINFISGNNGRYTCTANNGIQQLSNSATLIGETLGMCKLYQLMIVLYY